MTDYNRVKVYLKYSKKDLGFIEKDAIHSVIKIIEVYKVKVNKPFINVLEIMAEHESEIGDSLSKHTLSLDNLSKFYLEFKVALASLTLNVTNLSNVDKLLNVINFCSFVLTAIQRQDALVLEEQEHVEDSEND